MKKPLFVASALVLAAFGASPAFAQAAEGNWMMRVRAVHIDTANESDAIPGVLPADAIHVSNKTIPEVDFTYFLTPNIAAELILTVPQKHDVSIPALGGKVGTFKHLPPVLSVQYHFAPTATVRPYLGAGVNFTRIMSVDLGTADAVTQTLGGGNTGTNNLDRTSVGLSLQAGLDFKVGQNAFINIDVKKVKLRTDLENSALGHLAKVKVDPLLVGVGFGFKF